MREEIEKIVCGNILDTYHLEEALVYHYSHREEKAHDIGPYFKDVDIGAERLNNGYDNKDISQGIKTSEITIYNMQVRIYRPLCKKEKLPCIFYIHGGAFIAGSLKTVENPCKRLAELSNSCVISFAYDLAPEHPYPHAVNQCYQVMLEIISRKDEFHIDIHHLALAGDSAGGNIAMACAYKDAKDKKFINYLILYYPVVDVRKEADEKWNREIYGTYDNKFIHQCIYSLENCLDIVRKCYVQQNSVYDPYISPISIKDFEVMPPMLMVEAEFDYLRLQNEQFYYQMRHHNRIKVIQYQGVNHGFLEKLGVFPQADDSLQKAAASWLYEIQKNNHKNEKRI